MAHIPVARTKKQKGDIEMNVIAKGVIGAAILTAFGLSHAAGPIYYSTDGRATVQQLHLNPISDQFSGTTHLSSGFLCQASCTLTLNGEMSDDLLGDTTLTVTGGTVSGSNPLCGLLTISGFDWVGSIPHSSVPTGDLLPPVDFVLENVAVSASICGSCSGSIGVTFNSANGGSFDFDDTITPNGNCHVSGSLTSNTGKYYEVWH